MATNHFVSRRFETSLPEVFGHLHNTLKAITGRMRAEQFKVSPAARMIVSACNT